MTNTMAVESMIAYTYKGGGVTGLPVEYIPAETKYNLVLTEGAQYGYIGYKPNAVTVTDTGTALYDLDHYNGWGKIYFDFIPRSEPMSKQTARLTVSTTDPSIEPVGLNIILSPNPFLAKADPATILPGDTSNFILQIFEEGVGYRDFEENHEFYVELWDGWWYGDIYSEYENDVWWYWWDIPGPFSFISYDDIFEYENEDTDSVTVVVYAETYIVFDDDGNPLPTKSALIDKIAGSRSRNKLSRDDLAMLRKKFREERKKEMLENKGKKKGSVVFEKGNVKITELDHGSVPMEPMSSTTVYAYFDITITKEMEKDTFYVKADFEADTLFIGDTVNVIVKKVDKEGKEYEFPQSTKFEIGLLEGCSTGKILSADGRLEDYFESLQGPLRFVVSDNPDEADTLVKLRVGVPDTPDTVYQTYYSSLFQPKLISGKSETETLNKKSSNELTNVFCIALFNFSGHGIAEGVIEGDCDEFDACGDISYNYELVVHKNNFKTTQLGEEITIDVCPEKNGPNQMGGSEPEFYSFLRLSPEGNWVNAFRVKPCNNDKGKVQLKILEINKDEDIPTTFKIDFVEDICSSKIAAKNYIKINNDFKDISSISDPKNAMQDFCGHHCYPLELFENGYIIMEVLNQHEREHRADFEGVLDNLSNELFYEKLNQKIYDCKNYIKYVKGEEEGGLNQIMNLFVYKAVVEYYKISGKELKMGDEIVVAANPQIEKEHEKSIQRRSSVTGIIERYKKKLSFFKKQEIPFDCKNCPIEGE